MTGIHSIYNRSRDVQLVPVCVRMYVCVCVCVCVTNSSLGLTRRYTPTFHPLPWHWGVNSSIVILVKVEKDRRCISYPLFQGLVWAGRGGAGRGWARADPDETPSHGAT